MGTGMAPIKGSDTWPANWWQALKARFAPRWLLNRYPVILRAVK